MRLLSWGGVAWSHGTSRWRTGRRTAPPTPDASRGARRRVRDQRTGDLFVSTPSIHPVPGQYGHPHGRPTPSRPTEPGDNASLCSPTAPLLVTVGCRPRPSVRSRRVPPCLDLVHPRRLVAAALAVDGRHRSRRHRRPDRQRVRGQRRRHLRREVPADRQGAAGLLGELGRRLQRRPPRPRLDPDQRRRASDAARLQRDQRGVPGDPAPTARCCGRTAWTPASRSPTPGRDVRGQGGRRHRS